MDQRLSSQESVDECVRDVREAAAWENLITELKAYLRRSNKAVIAVPDRFIADQKTAVSPRRRIARELM